MTLKVYDGLSLRMIISIEAIKFTIGPVPNGNFRHDSPQTGLGITF